MKLVSVTLLTADSKNVWIKDIYHKHYPNYVKILEVLPGGYRAQIQLSVGYDVNKGPIEVFTFDQLTNDLMGD